MLIDFHVHTFLDKLAPGAIASLAARSHFTPFTDGTVADTERLMKEQGVDKFVALNIAVAPRTERHVNDFAVSLLSRPNIIPFGSVHPASEHALEELARLHAAGVRGVKFHSDYQGVWVDDPLAFPIFERCAEYGMIMLFHGGVDCGFEPPYKTPPQRMRRVAEVFPQAKIVVAHLGGQTMADEAIEYLADTNVYVDTSFSSRSVPAETAERVIRAFGVSRVLFGTDCPWDTPAPTVRYLEGMHFTKEELDLIFAKNALRLLGMKGE